MCGISGFIGTKNIKKTDIKKTLVLMKNRGPDSNGHIKFYDKKNKIFKIIDRDFVISLLKDKRSLNKYNKFIFSFISSSIFINNF